MNKRLIGPALALTLAAAPLAGTAGMGAEENFNIYGWQSWSYEFVEYDKDAANGGGDRKYDRLSADDANIGFMAYMDTGIDGLEVGLRCTQLTFWGRYNEDTQWCNHDSKISLRHETLGELMFAHWLLPFNAVVAGWIDPFYDVGADSHTSIMGNIGGAARGAGGADTSTFYNGGSGGFDDTDLGALSFNRRQEGVVQYIWPNAAAAADQNRSGFQFRFAVSEGSETDVQDLDDHDALPANAAKTRTVDPRIVSTGVAWQHNFAGGSQVWLATAYERHKDISITGLASLDDNDNPAYRVATTCSDSEDEGIRFAGRYLHDWGDGRQTMLATMWEELDYDADCVTKEAWADLERDAWMVSGKHVFGNGFDVRFSYMDADDWDCGGDVCRAYDIATNDLTDIPADDTGAEAYNLGLFYTLPAGTELRLTYSEVQNEDNAGYDFGINAATDGDAVGQDIELWAVGITHSFD